MAMSMVSNRRGAPAMFMNEQALNFFSACVVLVKIGAIALTNAVMRIANPRRPSTIRIRCRKCGRRICEIKTARAMKTAAAIKMLHISVLSFPNSLFSESVETSLRNVLAKTAIGNARRAAKLDSGITAPSSEGSIYFGTSHRPTKALSISAARQAQKSISEYHQKSPSFACSFANIDGYYIMRG